MTAFNKSFGWFVVSRKIHIRLNMDHGVPSRVVYVGSSLELHVACLDYLFGKGVRKREGRLRFAVRKGRFYFLCSSVCDSDWHDPERLEERIAKFWSLLLRESEEDEQECRT